MCRLLSFIFCLFIIAVSNRADASEPVHLPILAPITGFLALEGTSQRNGRRAGPEARGGRAHRHDRHRRHGDLA